MLLVLTSLKIKKFKIKWYNIILKTSQFINYIYIIYKLRGFLKLYFSCLRYLLFQVKIYGTDYI